MVNIGIRKELTATIGHSVSDATRNSAKVCNQQGWRSKRSSNEGVPGRAASRATWRRSSKICLAARQSPLLSRRISVARQPQSDPTMVIK